MGSLSFRQDELVYIDTQVIIYSVEQHPVYAPIIRPLWEAAKRGSIRVVSSELTILETLVQPFRKHDQALQDDYERALFRTEVQLLPISRPVLVEAARMRATATSLRAPDAIHAATARDAKCTMFLTNDHVFHRAPGISVVMLDDLRNGETPA